MMLGQKSGSDSFKDFLDIEAARFPFLTIWALLVAFQLLINFSVDALICALIAFLGASIGVAYAFRRVILLRSPISGLMIIGYIFYYFVLPPIATLLEGKSIVNNLDVPILVFLNTFACLLSLIIFHRIYLLMPASVALRVILERQVFKPLGMFARVGKTQLMMMGLLGVLANIATVGSAAFNADESVGALTKLIQAFYPLMYVPYCIVMLPLVGERGGVKRKDIFVLLGYTIIIVLLSIARNSRGVLFSGVASIFIAYLYGVCVRLFPRPRIKLFQLTIVSVLLLTLVNPVGDFITAMVVVRQYRADVGPMELIGSTFDQMADKEGLANYRADSEVTKDGWDESYVDNQFLARLANLKFADQNIGLARLLDESGEDFLRKLEWQRVLSILPQPIIDFLELDANKNVVNGASGGDLMLFAVTGSGYALGGYRTGSILGNAHALFGWFYPLVIGFISVWLFAFVDAQVSVRIKDENNLDKADFIFFNPLCITTLFTWTFYLTSAATGAESISGLFSFILRGWLQLVFIYGVALIFSHFFSKPLKGLLG